MGFRFRKSFKIAPGVRATLTHRGLSTSVGTKGLRVSHARRGTHLTAQTALVAAVASITGYTMNEQVFIVRKNQ